MARINKPTESGWWNWYEAGEEPKLLLIVVTKCGHAEVADDDAWTEAMGREPSEVMGENYWEGTACTQEYMPGTWEKAASEKGGE